MTRLTLAGLLGTFSVLLVQWGAHLNTVEALLPFWTGFAACIGSLAYLLNLPELLGKSQGTTHPIATVLLLPFFFVVRGAWIARFKLSREAPCNEIVAGLYIGRRPVEGELPHDVTFVVDLTSEFDEVLSIREANLYRNLPTLDGSVPPNRRDFDALVEEVSAYPKSVYIHCAYGHGRAALLASAVLLHRGLVSDAHEAAARLRAIRPKVRMSRDQRAWLRSRQVPRRS